MTETNMSFNARSWLLKLLVCWATLGNLVQATIRPNFVILMADDLGFGDVGCYGNDTIRTPNIDSLARDGARFTQSLTAGATCTPSRAAFLTGRYPIRSGLYPVGLQEVILFHAQTGGLPPNETTFAKRLLDAGYSTRFVGKWHLGVDCSAPGDGCHLPINHGFQHWYGIPLTNLKDFGDDGDSVVTARVPRIYTYLYSVIAGSAHAAVYMFSTGRTKLGYLFSLVAVGAGGGVLFVSNFKLLNSVLMRDNEVVEQPIRLEGLTQRFVYESEEFLQEQAVTESPFLLFLSFSKVHTALVTAQEFRGVSRHGVYGDSVEEMDWAVGRILSLLGPLGLVNSTFVYFTSDNGAHLEEVGVQGQRQGGYNGMLRGGKLMGGMEGGIRVPTLVRYPPLVKPGLIVDAPVSLMDISTTLIELADVHPPQNGVTDGRSLVSLLSNSTNESPHQFLFHYCGAKIHAARFIENTTTVWKAHFAHPDWLPGKEVCSYTCHCDDKYVIWLEQPELYNIQQDISERHPISPKSNTYRKVMRTIRNAIYEHSAAVVHVDSQLSLSHSLWRPRYQPCCNFPACHCTDPKYP